MRIEIPNKNEKQQQYVDRTQVTFKEIKGIRKKAEYLWEYYHTLFFAVVICVALIGGVATSVYKNMKYQSVFYCTLINNVLNDEQKNALLSDFSDYYELDEESEKMTFDDSFIIDYDENSIYQENTYYSTEKLTALIASRSIDCILTNEAVGKPYAETGAFFDLNEILPEDMKDSLSDRLATYIYKNEEDSIEVEGAYLIDISDTTFAQKYGIYQNPAYVGIVVNSENTDTAISFLRFIFEL